jgi:hypothetical protein
MDGREKREETSTSESEGVTADISLAINLRNGQANMAQPKVAGWVDPLGEMD